MCIIMCHLYASVGGERNRARSHPLVRRAEQQFVVRFSRGMRADETNAYTQVRASVFRFNYNPVISSAATAAPFSDASINR